MKKSPIIWMAIVCIVLFASAILSILTTPLLAPFAISALAGEAIQFPSVIKFIILSGNPFTASVSYISDLIQQGQGIFVFAIYILCTIIITLIVWQMWFFSNPERTVSNGVLGAAKLLNTASSIKKRNVLWDGQGKAPRPSLVYGYKQGKMVGDPSFERGWVCAKSGCGKSRAIGYPSLFWNIKAGASIIYTARKLTDYKLTAEAIEDYGIKTFLLDLERPKRGNRFNLMDTVNAFIEKRDIASAQKAARQLSADFIKHDSKNPYFSNAARALLTAVILIVAIYATEPKEKNLASVAKIIRSGMTGNGKDPAARLKDYIRSLGIDSPPYKAAAEFLQDNGTTAGRNVASTLMTGITILSDEGIEWMLSGSDFTLRQLLEEQCVLFPHCLGEDDPYNAILSAMYNQLWTTAQEASNENGEKLPHPFVILGDEWGNLPRVSSLGEWISLGRSMDFHTFLFVQNFSQLNKYNDEGDNGAGVDKLLGSMNLQIAMSVMKADPDGKYFCDLAGKKTVLIRGDSQNQTVGNFSKTSQGQSLTEQQVDLLPAYTFKDRVPLRDGIIVIKGGENSAPGNEGVFEIPIVDATKIKAVKEFFGLGTKSEDQQRCSDIEQKLRIREKTIDPAIPVWCPDFSKTETDQTHSDDIEYDEGLKWDS